MRVIRRAHFELSVDSFLVPIATGRTSLAERADSEVQKSQQCGQAERLAHHARRRSAIGSGDVL